MPDDIPAAHILAQALKDLTLELAEHTDAQQEIAAALRAIAEAIKSHNP
jgi:hypothetical protein